MPWNSGTFTREHDWTDDANADIDIEASRMDTEDDNFATGINQCINKDGSNTATQLNVDNIRIDANTISSTNSNGNVVIDPNGTGTVDVSSSRITSVSAGTSATDAATIGGTETLAAKTIALGSNTVSGTIAQFNTALTDADFATIAGTETLTGKTLTSPTINGATLSGTIAGTPTFSGAINTSSGYLCTAAVPFMRFIESDAAADNARWELLINSEQWAFQLVNDAGTVRTNFMEVNRTGTTVDSVNLLGTALTFNSVAIPTISSTSTLTNKTLTSPVLTTPTLGTPSSGTLTNCTGLPVSTGISGLGSNVATFLATPSSANLASAVTGETGSGALVFATSPTLVTPALGTPSSGTLTNCTGLPVAGIADYESSSYTGTATGLTTSPTGTVYYTRIGNKVTLTIPAINGTSNAETFTITGAGASIRPTSNSGSSFSYVTNNTTVVSGAVYMDSSGVLNFFVGLDGVFVNSGGKGLSESISFSYNLNQS